MLWLRTCLFTILVPGTELVLLPLAVIAYGLGPRLDFGPLRYSGLIPLLVGLAIILSCFVNFVRRGQGTPAPYDPPRRWSLRAFTATSGIPSTWAWCWSRSAKRCSAER